MPASIHGWTTQYTKAALNGSSFMSFHFKKYFGVRLKKHHTDLNSFG